MNAARPLQQAPATPGNQPGGANAVKTWGWSLMTLFIALMVGAMIVLIAKRLAFSGRLSTKNVKKRATDTRSAWEESGRRMQTPDSELKEEP